MKLQEMLQLRDSYQHLECPALPGPVYDDISKLIENPNIPQRWVEALGFVGACNFVISKYANGACSNQRASKALGILAEHLPADAQPRSYPPAHQLQKELNEALTQLIPFICGLRPASDAEAFRTPNRPHNYCQIKVGDIYEVSHYPSVDNDGYKAPVAVRLFGYLVAGIYYNMRDGADGVYEIWIDNYHPTHQSKYINVLCRALADFFGIKAPKFGTTSFISEPQSLDSEVTFVEFVKGGAEIRFGVAHNQDATPTPTPPLPPILTPPLQALRGCKMTTKNSPPCAPTPTQRGSKQGKRFSTAKVMRTKKPYVFALPFGAGQTLLKFQTPTHYTSGINGWKCNYYPTNHAMAGVVAGADTTGAHTHKISLELYASYAEHAETLHTTGQDNPRLPQLLDNWLILLLDRAIKEVQRSESAPRLPRGRPRKNTAPKNKS